jgi:hypothetical protein
MPTFITRLRTAAAIAVIAVAANFGIASASAKTTNDVKSRTHHVERAHVTRHARNHLRWHATHHARNHVKKHATKHAKKHATKHVKKIVKKPTAKAASVVTTSASATTSVTTTATTTATTPATSTNSTVVPSGPSGNWSMVFDDEFNGTSLSSSTWDNHNGYSNQNNVTDSSKNLSVANGDLTLSLSSANSGASLETTGAALNVGDYAEARINFAGNGKTIYNWPAFWAAGPGWPASGEQDIFEGLGSATVNYHYAVNGNNTQAGPFNIPGTWSNGFHTYGIYRGTNYCNVYWDGQLVKTYPTDDNGNPEYLILEMGAANTLQFGNQGQMVVDYVREWHQG